MMVGYALGSFVGMFCISSLYGFIYTQTAKLLSVKITQAWTHRPARFIILTLAAVQAVVGLTLYLFSCYMLYKGATFEPYASDYGYNYTGESDINFAWALFGAAMAISVISDIFKGIFILTFAD